MRNPFSFFGPQPKQRLSGAYLSCKLSSSMRLFYRAFRMQCGA
jgi:hypothetical protein